MSKLSPLQTVKKLHGTKDQLVSKVLELFTPAEGESREDYAKRLKYVANAKLLRLAWDGMSSPKLVISAGSCAISGAPYQDSPVTDRSFLDAFPPALYIPGCPPHPLTFVNGMLDLLGVGR